MKLLVSRPQNPTTTSAINPQPTASLNLCPYLGLSPSPDQNSNSSNPGFDFGLCLFLTQSMLFNEKDLSVPWWKWPRCPTQKNFSFPKDRLQNNPISPSYLGVCRSKATNPNFRDIRYCSFKKSLFKESNWLPHSALNESHSLSLATKSQLREHSMHSPKL